MCTQRFLAMPVFKHCLEALRILSLISVLDSEVFIQQKLVGYIKYKIIKVQNMNVL